MMIPNCNNCNNCNDCNNCHNWNIGRLVHQKTPFKWIGTYCIQLKKEGTGKTVPANRCLWQIEKQDNKIEQNEQQVCFLL